MTRFEAGVTHQKILLKELGYSVEGQKYRGHVKCTKEASKKAICKKIKGTKYIFLNTL